MIRCQSLTVVFDDDPEKIFCNSLLNQNLYAPGFGPYGILDEIEYMLAQCSHVRSHIYFFFTSDVFAIMTISIFTPELLDRIINLSVNLLMLSRPIPAPNPLSRISSDAVV